MYTVPATHIREVFKQMEEMFEGKENHALLDLLKRRIFANEIFVPDVPK